MPPPEYGPVVSQFVARASRLRPAGRDVTLGGSAQLTFSPVPGSDQTNFNSTVTITAVAPNAQFHRQNVVFVKPPKLTHVTIV